MARTFVSQPNQIFSSEGYNDALTPGATLQSSASTLEDDLNSIRTQIRQVLWAGVSGSWYDTVAAPSGSNSARGLNTINLDLTDLEQKRFLFRQQNLNVVQVATGSNFALLSVSLGTSPSDFAVVYHPVLPIPAATGTLVAALSGSEGSYGAHSLALISGTTDLMAKNLVVVRDAYTGMVLTGSGGRDIYGLLQVQSGTLTGQSFNDTTRKTQISFVIETVVNLTSSLAAVNSSFIGGKTIQYSYVRRTALDDIPEDAYLSHTIFVDLPDTPSGSFASYSDITLQNAINNQIGTVIQNKNIAIQLGAGYAWTYMSGNTNLWNLVSSGAQGNALTVNVNYLNFSSSNPASFEQGINVATGSATIQIGVTTNTINNTSGNLLISGANQVRFGDYFGGTSSIAFSTSSLEWSNYFSDFGNNTSILGALHILSQSASSSLHRTRYNAGVTANPSAANVNVTFPTNIDAQLGSYVGRDFKKDLEIYLNGILLLPGTTADQNDVYPGTSASTGDLKFPYKLKSGSQIAMVIYG